MEDNGNKLVSTLDNNDCLLSFNGNETFSEEIAIKFQLNCERAYMYRDYYTYLYGLPMKLNDKGTIINSKINEKQINGNSYWVLKATYTPDVGEGTLGICILIRTLINLKVINFFMKKKKMMESTSF